MLRWILKDLIEFVLQVEQPWMYGERQSLDNEAIFSILFKTLTQTLSNQKYELDFLSLCLQIECSSISEYSEKIIKSNHLHNGKHSLVLQAMLVTLAVPTANWQHPFDVK